MRRIIETIRWIVTLPIVAYQKTLSPDHGLTRAFYPHGYCRYYPSCSEYTRQAILYKGVLLGIPMGLWRILRCNPFSKGGMDPVKK